MSIAAAIALGTGLTAGEDFHVQDHGAGPFLAIWDTAKLGPRPTQSQIDAWLVTWNATATKRDGQATIKRIADEYIQAFIINQEFGDNTRLLAVKAKIAAWKTAHPGVVP